MKEIGEEGNILPLDAYLCKVGWVGQDLFSFWDYLHYFIHLRLAADLVLATTPAIFKSDPARIHPSTVNAHMCTPVAKLWEVIGRRRGRDKVVLLFLACGDIISKLGLNQQGQTRGSACCWDHLGWVSRAATAARTPFVVLVIFRNEASP